MNSKPIILAIVNDPDLGLCIKENLALQGYQVDWADQLKDAMNLVNEKLYDSVVIDSTSTEKNSSHQIRELLQMTSSSVVIILTDYSDTKNILEAFDFGVADYIIKDAERRFIDLLPVVISRNIKNQKIIQESKRYSIYPQKLFCDSISEGLWCIDTYLNTIFVNQPLCYWLGVEENTIQSQSISNYIHPDCYNEFASLIQQGSVGDRKPRDLVLKSKNFGHVPFQVEIRQISVNHDQLYGFVLIFKPIHSDGYQKIKPSVVSEGNTNWINLVSDFIWESDSHGRFVFTNDRCYDRLGFMSFEILGQPIYQYAIPSERESINSLLKNPPVNGDSIFHRSFIFSHKQGHQVIMECTLMVLYDENNHWVGYRGICRDMTQLSACEKKISRHQEIERMFYELSQLLICASPSQSEICHIILDYGKRLTKSPYGFVSTIDDKTGDMISHTLTPMMGERCNLTGENQKILFQRKPDKTYPGLWGHALNEKKGFYTNNPQSHPASAGLPLGHIPIITFLSVPAVYEGEILGLIALANAEQYNPEDLIIIERLAEIYAMALYRNKREWTLLNIQAQYRNLFDTMLDGFAFHEIITDENGKPVDYRFIDVNPAFEEITGLSADFIKSKTVLEVFPQIDSFWIEIYGQVALTGKAMQFENYFKELNKYFLIKAYSPLKNHSACVFQDITYQKTAEEKIRLSEERFRSLFENSMDAIVIADREGNYVNVNPAACQLFNIDYSQFIKMNVSDLKKADGTSPKEDYLKFVQKKYEQGEFSFICPDGELRVVEYTAFQLHPDLFVSMMRNITHRKMQELALQKSEKKFKMLFYGIMDMVGIIQYSSGQFIDVNDAFCKETGFTRDEIIHHTLIDLDLWLDSYQWQQFEHALQNKGFIRDEEICLKMKNGEIKTFLINSEIIFLDNDELIFIILKNITERKKIELKLLYYAAEMEMINDELRQYTTIITHDLRSPMVNLIGFSNELKEQIHMLRPAVENLLSNTDTENKDLCEQLLSKEIPESLTFIDQSVKRMNVMIEALVKFARIGRLEIERKPVDLNKIVQNIINSLSFNIREKNIHIDISPLPVIMSDALAIDQILGNVITNAVQYTHPERESKIIIRADLEGKEIKISIADNGIGILPEDEGKVFAPFRRGSNVQVSGDGIGMAFVRLLVRKLGGTIYFNSVPNEGTTFFIHLPQNN